MTAVFELPVTVAVNCLLPPDPKLAVKGDSDTATTCGGDRVIVAVPKLAGFATLVAVTVTVCCAVIVAMAPCRCRMRKLSRRRQGCWSM